ncbi:class C sortase [Aerococcus sp. 1KP-2016]|uniref:class C sortase n=1 Tax=Aerococcus sp. 1KP-2016 TaxID=1981982 RepID=UPI000B980A3A|nr:class C sortase [Aerococcus sp. 1KP-2016]OYQ68334.1 hypothetical protein B9P78_00565 [Aerococcus sp. 1KP-2016]
MRKQLNKKSNVILMLGLFFGMAIMLYPLASQLYYDAQITSVTEDYRNSLDEIDIDNEIDERVKLAEAYNEALDPNLNWQDPYSEEEREQGISSYAEMLEVHEQIGIVNIPKINVELPIYAGSSEQVLQKGVGHLEGTSLPVGGENTHSVLTAHRGLPEARLFTDLDKMVEGDIFYVETMAGQLYYEVDQIKVVEPTDIDAVRIEEGEDYVTLLTCTPYMINSHRLLVRGHRIPAPEEAEIVAEDSIWEKMWHTIQPYWHYIALILLVIIIISIVIWRINRK